MVEEAHKDYVNEEKTMINISKMCILGMSVPPTELMSGRLIGGVTGEPFSFSAKSAVKAYVNNIKPLSVEELKELSKKKVEDK